MSGYGKIHPSGWRVIPPIWALILVVLIFSEAVILNILLIAVGIFVAYFYFVPERTPLDSGMDAIVSPVDGTVFRIERLENGTELYIRKRVFDSSAVRSPVEGEMVEQRHLHGIFLDDEDPKASRLNEQGHMVYRWHGRNVSMRIVSGLYALGLPIFATGRSVGRGTTQALLSEGYVQLLLPNGSDIAVSTGDRVVGGETVLARKVA